MFTKLAKLRRMSSWQINAVGFLAVVAAVLGCFTPVHSEEGYLTKFIGKERFAVPKQYLHPRPVGDQGDKCPSCGFGIQFWIPDLRPPEKDLFFKPEFRPSEAQRPSPAPGEVVVKVTKIEYVGQPPIEDINTAETRIASTLDLFNDTNSVFEDFGQLTRIFSRKSPDGPQRFYEKSSERNVFLFCAGNTQNQICQGFADFPEYAVTSRFHFPISEIRNYRIMVEGIDKLLRKWNVK